MISRILKVKEWKFQKQAMDKLHDYFAVSQLSNIKKELILYHFHKILETGKFNNKLEETLAGIDRAIESWKKRKKNKNS